MKAFFQIQKFFTLVAIVASLGFITACGSDSDDDATQLAGVSSVTVEMKGGKDGAAASGRCDSYHRSHSRYYSNSNRSCKRCC